MELNYATITVLGIGCTAERISPKRAVDRYLEDSLLNGLTIHKDSMYYYERNLLPD